MTPHVPSTAPSLSTQLNPRSDHYWWRAEVRATLLAAGMETLAVVKCYVSKGAGFSNESLTDAKVDEDNVWSWTPRW